MSNALPVLVILAVVFFFFSWVAWMISKRSYCHRCGRRYPTGVRREGCDHCWRPPLAIVAAILCLLLPGSAFAGGSQWKVVSALSDVAPYDAAGGQKVVFYRLQSTLPFDDQEWVVQVRGGRPVSAVRTWHVGGFRQRRWYAVNEIPGEILQAVSRHLARRRK